MKKQSLIIALIFTLVTAVNAQISLDHVYSVDGPEQAFKLSLSGLKYFAQHYTTNSVSSFILYNPDHTIFKTINVPPIAGKQAKDIAYVSETLFDLDTLVEYMLYYQDMVSSVSEVRVLNENGNVLLAVDSANFTANGGNDPYKGYISKPIFPNGTQSKLYLKVNFPPNQDHVRVYNLPGQLACLECDNGVVSGLIQEPNLISENKNSLAFPNPFTDYVKIKYSLPSKFNYAFINLYDITGNLIKKKEIDRHYEEILISNEEIKQGAYIYQIVVDDKIISTDKIIKL
jgi:hypothetical protein